MCETFRKTCVRPFVRLGEIFGKRLVDRLGDRLVDRPMIDCRKTFRKTCVRLFVILGDRLVINLGNTF